MLCVPTVVNAGAEIGADAVIGDQAQVRERARIGAESVVGRGTAIDNDVTIGAHVKIQSNCYVTAGAVTSGYIGRITAVVNAANGNITFSTTAKSGTFPTASAGAHTISLRVGGACRGPAR